MMRTATPKPTQLRVRRRSSSSVLGTRSVLPTCSAAPTATSTEETIAVANRTTTESSASETNATNIIDSWLPDVQRKYTPVPLATDKLNVSVQRVIYEKASSRRIRHRDILRDLALQEEKFINDSNDDNDKKADTTGSVTTHAFVSGSNNLVALKRNHYTTSITLGSSNNNNRPSKAINIDLLLDNNDPRRKNNRNKYTMDPEEVFVHQLNCDKVLRNMNGWRHSYFTHFHQKCNPNGDMLLKSKANTKRRTTKISNKDLLQMTTTSKAVAIRKKGSIATKACRGNKSSIKTKLMQQKR
jgi:hypothetical protein